jgi:hypothetical protein
MKTLPATTSRAAKPCLSPVAVWQMLLTRLLEQHYGLTLNDTPFSDETVITGTYRCRYHAGRCREFSGGKIRTGVSIAKGLAGRNNHLIFGL